jgi:hypothetical protein
MNHLEKIIELEKKKLDIIKEMLPSFYKPKCEHDPSCFYSNPTQPWLSTIPPTCTCGEVYK